MKNLCKLTGLTIIFLMILEFTSCLNQSNVSVLNKSEDPELKLLAITILSQDAMSGSITVDNSVKKISKRDVSAVFAYGEVTVTWDVIHAKIENGQLLVGENNLVFSVKASKGNYKAWRKEFKIIRRDIEVDCFNVNTVVEGSISGKILAYPALKSGKAEKKSIVTFTAKPDNSEIYDVDIWKITDGELLEGGTKGSPTAKVKITANTNITVKFKEKNQAGTEIFSVNAVVANPEYGTIKMTSEILIPQDKKVPNGTLVLFTAVSKNEELYKVDNWVITGGEVQPGTGIAGKNIAKVKITADTNVSVSFTDKQNSYDMITPIPAGSNKIIIGTDSPKIGSLNGPDSKGCFISNRIVELGGYKIGKYEVNYELWYNIRTEAEKIGYVFMNKGMQGSNTGGGNYPDFKNIGMRPIPPSSTPSDDTDAVNSLHPVTMISWRDAIVWCNAYSELSGLEPVYYYNGEILKDSSKNRKLPIFNWYDCDACEIKIEKNGYRLPTEAEWEFAARGGDSSNINIWNCKYSGNDNLNKVGWMEVNSLDRTHECGKKSANTLGIFDMTGNVDEWCCDIYEENLKLNLNINPIGKILENPTNEDFHSVKRIYRGGNFFMENDSGVVYLRKNNEPYIINNGLGFRLACTLK